ncbi:enoyl-CoA delta isomerase 2-like isoform X2 [Branchiostoma floridae]|uniref:Delta(3),Delta(2)-enoyl-CoA isomerase n=1 Tax=Branchiostoma floridae TaxID=7739 RepID=A0A9J7L968_BRAFL|nr:enoyl-CoA delta isomerase 2-like isoform X2 [Branchiostoma floridae]
MYRTERRQKYDTSGFSGQRCLLNSRVQRTQFLHMGRTAFGAHDAAFEAAKERLNTLKEEPDNNVKLQIYALFKQATKGPCNTPKPGAFDFVGRAKWQAWSGLGDISQDEAQKQYIDIINGLAGEESPAETEQAGEEASSYKEIKVTKENKVCSILLNRPAKKNAITWLMYNEIVQALDDASKDDSVTVAVITGAGDYYCSGNDLGNFMNIDPKDMPKMARDGKELLRRFVTAFIDFPKPLIGAVNGPAVGVSVTVLGLFDAVYATDKATFHTPFTELGQSAEGCSSYVFPKLMGNTKANEMLLFNKKLTAHEACERGLVTEVLPHDSFQKEVQTRVEYVAQLPPQSVREGKKLVRDQEREDLHKANEKECEVLEGRWLSEECVRAIMSFFTKKARL